MSKQMMTSWRTTIAIGWMVGAAVVCPLAAYAQAADDTPAGPQASGAVVAVGGVTTAPAIAGGASAQGRPLVLPNTGTGPADADGISELLLAAGIAAIGAGAFVRSRTSGRARSGSASL